MTANFETPSVDIEEAYSCFAEKGKMHSSKRFDVGATKILHWLFPDLFLIVDRNVTQTFKKFLNVEFLAGMQPGHRAKNYFKCLSAAQREIKSFGETKFRELVPNAPIARVFDKIAFMVGGGAIGTDAVVW